MTRPSALLARAGNTSACAEKRPAGLATPAKSGKYLRVCGEETFSLTVVTSLCEIPPRVRRIVAHLRLYHQETRKSASPVDKGWQKSSLHKRKFPRVMSYSPNTCNGRFALSMHSATSKPKPKNHDHSPLILPRIFGETYNVTPRNQRHSPTSRMGTAALFEVLIQQALLVAIYILGHSE